MLIDKEDYPMKSGGKRSVLSDDGTVRRALMELNDCYVERSEIEAFETLVSSKNKIKFEAGSFGTRISSRPETLRLLFMPFMTSDPFIKYSKVERISAAMVSKSGNEYAEFMIELGSPVYYLETQESEIKISKMITVIKKLVSSSNADKDNVLNKMDGKTYFEMEVSKFEQVFVRRDFILEVDDISIFFKAKKVNVFGDNGILSARNRITNTAKNREMILRIIKAEGVFEDVFSTQVQFSESDLGEKVIPKIRWNKFFERESARMTLNMLVGQKSISQQLFIDVMGRMKGNSHFSKMMKSSRKLKNRFKNDHAIMLLIAMS
jgi:hypothetical protein